MTDTARTFETVEELLNAVYHVFGSGVMIDQWGHYFAPQQVQRDADTDEVTVVVTKIEKGKPRGVRPKGRTLWD